MLRELAGVEVSAKQVERVAETLGAAIAADERQSVEKTAPPAPTLYLGMDGTGVVEAGCKVVINARLKRAGMHRALRGANAIIALRCSKLSGRFEDFWARPSNQMKMAA